MKPTPKQIISAEIRERVDAETRQAAFAAMVSAYMHAFGITRAVAEMLVLTKAESEVDP